MVLHKTMKIPSAEPERKTPDHGYMWICPECGLEVHSDFRRCVRCGWDRPSAEPERKKGKWISEPFSDEYEYDVYRCSACMKPMGIGSKKTRWFNFCPNCGADMRGEEDGQG